VPAVRTAVVEYTDGLAQADAATELAGAVV
jgi:hypothetical protein